MSRACEDARRIQGTKKVEAQASHLNPPPPPPPPAPPDKGQVRLGRKLVIGAWCAGVCGSCGTSGRPSSMAQQSSWRTVQELRQRCAQIRQGLDPGAMGTARRCRWTASSVRSSHRPERTASEHLQSAGPGTCRPWTLAPCHKRWIVSPGQSLRRPQGTTSEVLRPAGPCTCMASYCFEFSLHNLLMW